MQKRLSNWMQNNGKLRYVSLGLVFSRLLSLAYQFADTAQLPNMFENKDQVGQKALDAFDNCIRVSKEIKANGVLGQAYLHLGLLEKSLGNPEKAKANIEAASIILKDCQASTYLEQAKSELKVL